MAAAWRQLYLSGWGLIFSATPQMAYFLGNSLLGTLFCERTVISYCPLLNEAEHRTGNFLILSFSYTGENTMIPAYVANEFSQLM